MRLAPISRRIRYPPLMPLGANGSSGAAAGWRTSSSVYSSRYPQSLYGNRCFCQLYAWSLLLRNYPFSAGTSWKPSALACALSLVSERFL